MLVAPGIGLLQRFAGWQRYQATSRLFPVAPTQPVFSSCNGLPTSGSPSGSGFRADGSRFGSVIAADVHDVVCIDAELIVSWGFSGRALAPSASMRSKPCPESVNRIWEPSGDHDGAKAEKSGTVVPVASACGFVPSAFTTQIEDGFDPTTNASLLLSGAHASTSPLASGARTLPRCVSWV